MRTYLLFRQLESLGQVGPLWAGEVALVGEATLQLEDLGVAEGRPAPLLPGGALPVRRLSWGRQQENQR